jgi:proline iminopeptidase
VVRKYAVVSLILVIAMAAGCEKAPQRTGTGLWPEIEPFETGYLQVSDMHKIYYELCGNRDGIPVFVLHGGPGGKTSAYERRFFDPEKYLVVLHHQRGCGKSKPCAELKENDTWALVDDIERLRRELKLGKVILFGGSWGTTLALAHAEKYPQFVHALVLRGVFTATDAEIDHFYHGGAAKFFPEVYERFLGELPDPERRPLPQYLFELIRDGDAEEKKKYSLAWGNYEVKMAALEMPDDVLARIWETEDPYVFGLFENYYMANRCFLEEGQLLENAHLLSGIPTYIVNGRYDVICPPGNAYELYKRIPGSEIVIAESSGHWMGEPNIERELVRIFEEIAAAQ